MDVWSGGSLNRAVQDSEQMEERVGASREGRAGRKSGPSATPDTDWGTLGRRSEERR